VGDVRWCGVSEGKIRRARPVFNEEVIRYLYDWMTERHLIFKRKNAGEPAPWTTDPVLLQWRFCNVRRELDRESRALIERIVKNPDLCYRAKVLNCIWFRLFNKQETFEILGPLKLEDFAALHAVPRVFQHYKERFEEYRRSHPSYQFFTNAFHTRGLLAQWKQPPQLNGGEVASDNERMLYMIDHIYSSGLLAKIAVTADPSYVKPGLTQSDVFNTLCTIRGIGSFLAYQMFVDFTYIAEFPFSENEFTVSCPGCKAGLSKLFDDRAGMSDEELLFWLRDSLEAAFNSRNLPFNQHELFDDLPEDCARLNVMCLENAMCELSKYTRVRQDAGTPRVRYEASTAPLPGATTVWNTGKGSVKTASSGAKKRTAAVQPTLDRYLVKKTAVGVGEGAG